MPRAIVSTLLHGLGAAGRHASCVGHLRRTRLSLPRDCRPAVGGAVPDAIGSGIRRPQSGAQPPGAHKLLRALHITCIRRQLRQRPWSRTLREAWPVPVVPVTITAPLVPCTAASCAETSVGSKQGAGERYRCLLLSH